MIFFSMKENFRKKIEWKQIPWKEFSMIKKIPGKILISWKGKFHEKNFPWKKNPWQKISGKEVSMKENSLLENSMIVIWINRPSVKSGWTHCLPGPVWEVKKGKAKLNDPCFPPLPRALKWAPLAMPVP